MKSGHAVTKNIRIYMYIRVYIRIYTYIRIFICIYIYIYIYTCMGARTTCKCNQLVKVQRSTCVINVQ